MKNGAADEEQCENQKNVKAFWRVSSISVLMLIAKIRAGENPAMQSLALFNKRRVANTTNDTRGSGPLKYLASFGVF